MAINLPNVLRIYIVDDDQKHYAHILCSFQMTCRHNLHYSSRFQGIGQSCIYDEYGVDF